MKDIIQRKIVCTRILSGGITLFLGISLLFVMPGCSFFGRNEEDIVLIQIGDIATTVGDFKKRFETTKTAYPHNELQEENVYKKAQVRLLNQIVEEMIVLERADELGIKISDTELEKAVLKIKEDYPKDVFEEMLLENAISYESWKEELRTRLIIEKTIREEVESKIEILPEDISNYYKQRRKKENIDASEGNAEKESEEVVVSDLRRKKSEEAYHEWLKKLQKRYTIEINNKAWEELTNL
jgi:hypothetical protein